MIEHWQSAAVVVGLLTFGIAINRETLRQFSSLPTLREIWPLALMFWGGAGVLMVALLWHS